MIRISLSRVEIAGGAAPAAHREAFAQRHLVVFKRFMGRCYKLPPGGGYFDSWHRDCHDNRRLGLSINLSETPKCNFAGWFFGEPSFRDMIRLRPEGE